MLASFLLSCLSRELQPPLSSNQEVRLPLLGVCPLRARDQVSPSSQSYGSGEAKGAVRAPGKSQRDPMPSTFT